MDLIDILERLASKAESSRGLLETEEATKNALIMPLINALGYNVFDPAEVTPEFTADVGMKKGEKVDYAINIGGSPMILIECKSIADKLNFKHASQLYRYYGVTDARFAVLTNGVHYWFYTDLESTNRMDERPFFEFDLLDFDRNDVNELKKFSKSTFDLENILSNASELKYVKQIQKNVETEFESPSEEFVKMFGSRVYSGRFTSAVAEQFSPLVKSALRRFIQESLSDSLKSALRGVNNPNDQDADSKTSETDTEDDDGIVTTAEEVEGFHIVRAMLANQVKPSRIVMRDTKSYCGVLLDDNNRKPICRLHFNYSKKYIGTFDAEKKETRHAIEDLCDLYKFSDQLSNSVSLYIDSGK